MGSVLYSIMGILIPFIGTSLGSGFVFFMKNSINDRLKKIIIGFAAGVMIAASIWSLIIPSIEIAKQQNIVSFIPATVGLITGILFLIFINSIGEKIKEKRNEKKINMLLLSVTLHNIPEGMAVGVCFAGFLSKNIGISGFEAMLLAIGIAIQNIPEGAIISMPLTMKGMCKKRAFIYGVLSGIVEPIAALLSLLIINVIVPVLAYLLAFAAGAMIYVVVEELIPEMHEKGKSKLGVISLVIGFVLMMILDIAF